MTAVPEPGRGRAWYAVVVLGVLYALSFIDRFILALLVGPIGKEFHTTDAQMGLLIGAGFALVYSVAGLPLAHLLDKGQRRLIVTFGVLLWSVMTVASAFAANFEMLAVFRTGVAVGEAVLTPAAISLIADLFASNRRALPTSSYTSVASYMGIGAFMVGGAALGLAQTLSPGLGMAPWRLTLVIVGLPGALIAALFLLTVAEPARKVAQGEAAGPADLRSFMLHLAANWRFYLPLMLGIASGAIINFGVVSWMPTLLARAHHHTPAVAGLLFGGVIAPLSLAGAFLWPQVSTLLGRGSRAGGLVLCLAACTLLALPCLALGVNAADGVGLLAGVGATLFLLACFSVLGPLAIQVFAPGRMLARLMSMTLLCSNVLGFGLGPWAVPYLAGLWPGDPRALGYGMALTAAIVVPVSTLCFVFAWRAVGGRPDGATAAPA